MWPEPAACRGVPWVGAWVPTLILATVRPWGFDTKQAGGKVRPLGWKVLPKQEDIRIIIVCSVLDCCSL